MVYIPNAVPSGTGTDNLTPLGSAGDAVHLTLAPAGAAGIATTVVVNNQGLVDILQAGVTGVEPKKAYFLALSNNADGSGHSTLSPNSWVTLPVPRSSALSVRFESRSKAPAATRNGIWSLRRWWTTSQVHRSRSSAERAAHGDSGSVAMHRNRSIRPPCITHASGFFMGGFTASRNT